MRLAIFLLKLVRNSSTYTTLLAVMVVRHNGQISSKFAHISHRPLSGIMRVMRLAFCDKTLSHTRITIDNLPMFTRLQRNTRNVITAYRTDIHHPTVRVDSSQNQMS